MCFGNNKDVWDLITARNRAVPVTSLKVGDILLLNLQEETFQSGIQMQEFFVEK
jgi:3-dehydroquinate synthase class II